MAVVTCDEVRARLQKTSAEIADTVLNSAAFIPAGEAWLEKKGITYTGLNATDAVLAKGAVIAFVCARIISTGPEAGGKWGPMSANKITGAEQKDSIKAFMSEADDFLSLLGVESGEGWFAICGQGTEDYDEAANDLTETIVL